MLRLMVLALLELFIMYRSQTSPPLDDRPMQCKDTSQTECHLQKSHGEQQRIVDQLSSISSSSFLAYNACTVHLDGRNVFPRSRRLVDRPILRPVECEKKEWKNVKHTHKHTTSSAPRQSRTTLTMKINGDD